MKWFPKRLFSKTSTIRRSRPAQQPRLRLAIESLEGRTVPSTLQITNGLLTYTAGAGVSNRVTVAVTGNAYTITDSEKITVTGIPPQAYEYVVNGKPALDWVIERQCVKADKDSGIVNDANDWAIETMKNPRYPLELFLRVITVSLETMKIVRALPTLNLLGQ